jgi:L-lactate dehydrogenase complex protein LldF
VVHWAENASEACRIVVDIAKQNGVKTVAKSKSMVSEEVGLNDALIEAGIEPIETDLGEYILQINDAEPPSHIVMPVIHKTAEDVADLFHAKHGTPRKTDPAALTREAREILRPKFLSADMGVSGANFLVAETGSTLIVTNEGNGRLCTTLPRLHVALTGIEKVVPTLEDVSTLLRLLPRSATGQAITNYVSLHTGPKRLEESDGPQQFHIVLVDNGRSKLLAGEMREMLRCIRCGACMNHCPVYQAVGGHAYGWVYPGPMGNILTPSYVGLENAIALPNAATMCNQCGVVCPVKIPLPDLMRKLREEQMATRPQALAGARGPRPVGLGGAAAGALRLRHAHRRALHEMAGRRRKADPPPAARHRLDGWPRFPGAGGKDFPRAIQKEQAMKPFSVFPLSRWRERAGERVEA